jgi:hypothetical protein
MKSCVGIYREGKARSSVLVAGEGGHFVGPSPNISVNADVRELAFVHHLAGASNVAVVSLWQARGRRLP